MAQSMCTTLQTYQMNTGGVAYGKCPVLEQLH